MSFNLGLELEFGLIEVQDSLISMSIQLGSELSVCSLRLSIRLTPMSFNYVQNKVCYWLSGIRVLHLCHLT